MSQELIYPGVPVHIGGKRFTVPSLSIRQFQQYYDVLTVQAVGDDLASVTKRFEETVPVIGAAIRRNYPDVKDEWLAEELDLISLPLALKAIQNASGLVPVEPGN